MRKITILLTVQCLKMLLLFSFPQFHADDCTVNPSLSRDRPKHIAAGLQSIYGISGDIVDLCLFSYYIKFTRRKFNDYRQGYIIFFSINVKPVVLIK